MANVNIPSVIGVDYTAVDTAISAGGKGPAFGAGTEIETEDGVYRYVQINEAAGVAVGQWVLIPASATGDYEQAELLDTTNSAASGKMIGVAIVAAADNSYTWVFRGKGVVEAVVTDATADDTVLTTTATAGQAGTGGDTIQGASTAELSVLPPLTSLVKCASLLTTNV